MQRKLIRTLFVVAAAYDGLLGAAFLVAWPRLFDYFQVTPPNHAAYVQFPALLLVLFAVLFVRIALDPVGRRELILYGCGLKIAYSSVAFGHQLTRGIPSMWLPWAWADLVFLVLFAIAWRWARAEAAGR